MDFTNDEQNFLMKIACQTIRRRLEGISTAPPVTPLNPQVLKMAGCFVSLHNGQTHVLRGCIGRIDCATPLLHGRPRAIRDLRRTRSLWRSCRR
jgi:AMMECR1 domain-containing protein